MPVKIILVEDHEIVRQGVHALLRNEPGIEIMGEAGNGEEALKLCKQLHPDLVIMDMNMPVMSGNECTRILNKEFPLIKVLILSMHDYESHLIEMLDVGAEGYLLKSAQKDELMFAIKKISEGGIYISPEFTHAMVQKYRAGIFIRENKHPDIALTEGEIGVLDLIGEGFTNIEIANKLFISVRTVESRRKKVLEKTGATNTATMMKFCIRNGLIT